MGPVLSNTSKVSILVKHTGVELGVGVWVLVEVKDGVVVLVGVIVLVVVGVVVLVGVTLGVVGTDDWHGYNFIIPLNGEVKLYDVKSPKTVILSLLKTLTLVTELLNPGIEPKL